MKTKHLLLAFSMLGVFVVAGLLLVTLPHSDSRKAYEQYLVSEYHTFPKSVLTEEAGEAKALDKPEMAALADFIQTVDPALKAVPRERILAANQQTENLARLKIGYSPLLWNPHPTNMGGRTRSLMFDPNDPNHTKLWAGSVTGGLWYNIDPSGSGEWTPVNDFWPNLAISCLAYDPNNTQTFYAGTGESQTAMIIYRESSGKGTGIMRSTDGGETWESMASTKDWAYVTDILVRNENGQSVIYAGVASGVYKGVAHRNETGDGLYRSTDGGSTWTQVLPDVPGKDFSYAPSDIETSADGAVLFVGTTYGVNKEVTDNDRSGAACILVSSDGLTWTVDRSYNDRILADSVNQYPGRVMLSKAPSNPDIVYAIIASGYVRSDGFIGYGCQFLVKTTDKGATWSEVNYPYGFASLAWHAFVITVSPFNPNIIWVGGLDVYRTVNGGTSWTRLSDWLGMYYNGGDDYVHADIHAIVYKPGSDTEMYIGTDGGVFGTRSASAPDANMKFFESANNYSTLQYYSCAMHPDAGSIHFMGGLQDNGTMFYRRGNTPTFRDMLSGGDGALCFIDQDQPTIQITSVYHNQLYLYGGNKEANPQYTGYRNLNSGMFVNPMDYDWKNNILFANGANEQLERLNQLHVVTVSATNFSGGTPAKNLNTQSQVPYSNIKWSRHSPQNQSNIYIGTQAGKLFKYADASRNGTLTELTFTGFPTANISSIDIAGSEDTLLVTFSNYGVASVWLTVDGGQSWRNVEANLPDMPVRWGIFHPRSGQQVMLATETGIWTTDNILANQVIWTPNQAGMANVRIDMLNFRSSDNTVLAATHGRGFYTAVWPAIFTNKKPDTTTSQAAIRLFPNPTQGMFEIVFTPRQQTRLIISDLNGRIVLTETIGRQEYPFRKTVDLTREARGTYLVGIESNGVMDTHRVILQ